MNHRPNLTCMALLAPCLFSGDGMAQDEGFMLEEVQPGKPKSALSGEVEAGVGYNTEDSFKLGEYTGLKDKGPYAIGNFSLLWRDAHDSGRARYFEATGLNLGLDYRSVRLRHGDQGRYDLVFDYDQIPHFLYGYPGDKAVTPYTGAGSGSLRLPGDWEAAPTTGGMTNLQTSLTPLEMKTDRKRFGGGLTWTLAQQWAWKTNFQHEDKDGLDSIAGAFGTNGGNPSAIFLPQPIDYKTDTLNTSIEYTDRRAQLQLAYELSLFNNAQSSLLFQNPYSAAGRGSAWTPVTGYPTGFGQMALPPDNTAHHLTLSGGYNFGETTRATANLAYGSMLQNTPFLPYSAIPALNATVTAPLPRNSLDGRIETFLADLGFSSRPFKDLDLRARYHYENRDNKTPQDIYVRIAGDAQNQAQGLANASARINLPYSSEQNKVSLDAGYRILPRTKFSLGYDYDQRNRDFQERFRTDEHTARAKFSTTPFEFANGWVEYTHAWRGGTTYVDNAPFLYSHTPAFLATLAPDERFENLPALRKYYMAKRDRDRVQGVVTIVPHEKITLTLDGSYAQDNYGGSTLGLQKSRTASATLNAAYSPRQDLSTFAFLTYDNVRYEQAGYGHNPVSAPSLTNPAQDWFVSNQDEIVTGGAGLNWTLIENKLDLGLDYTVSFADTRIRPESGGTTPVLPLSNVTTRFQRVGARLNYKLKNHWSVRFAYRYETLRTEDFARDNIALNTMPFVLTMGSTSPDYRAHLFGVSVAYSF